MSKITLLLCTLLVSLVSGCGHDGLCLDSKDCVDLTSTQILIDEDISILPDTKAPKFFQLATGGESFLAVKWMTNSDNTLETGIFPNSAWNNFASTGNKDGAVLYEYINADYMSDPIKLTAFDKTQNQTLWVLGFACNKTPTAMMPLPCSAHVTLKARYDIIVKNSNM